jgi:hypothetical protein
MTEKKSADTAEPSEKAQALAKDQKMKTPAWSNNPCGMCRAMRKPTCSGHGGGSSGGGGGESGASAGAEKNGQSLRASTVESFELLDPIISWMNNVLINESAIDYEAGIFSVHMDRLAGELIIKLLPQFLGKEYAEIVKEYFSAIKQEFEKFKDTLKAQGIATKDFTLEMSDMTLSIKIPTPAYYDAFVKQLAKANLLPVPEFLYELQSKRLKSTQPSSVISSPKIASQQLESLQMDFKRFIASLNTRGISTKVTGDYTATVIDGSVHVTISNPVHRKEFATQFVDDPTGLVLNDKSSGKNEVKSVAAPAPTAAAQESLYVTPRCAPMSTKKKPF